jgi:hypothetical protein
MNPSKYAPTVLDLYDASCGLMRVLHKVGLAFNAKPVDFRVFVDLYNLAQRHTP